MATILVVEDDRSARRLMEITLRGAGYLPLMAEDGVRALEILSHTHADLAVADVMMPRMDGYELTRTLRALYPGMPILLVTALEMPADKRRGFLAGTDDYMVKPVDEEELLLRIRALLRRARVAGESRLTVGDVTLDAEAMTVSRGAEKTTLPQKEFLLLFKLLSYPGKIFTRLQLMDEIWGEDSESGERTVNVHINRLRDRFADCGAFAIVTVRGLGYKAEIK